MIGWSGLRHRVAACPRSGRPDGALFSWSDKSAPSGRPLRSGTNRSNHLGRLAKDTSTIHDNKSIWSAKLPTISCL